MDSLPDITKLIEVVILVIIAPFIPIAVTQLKRWLDTQLTLAQQKQIIDAVQMAVLAAEQLGLSGNEAKRQAALMTERALIQVGVSADMDHVLDLIEAEVYSQFNRSRNA